MRRALLVLLVMGLVGQHAGMLVCHSSCQKALPSASAPLQSASDSMAGMGHCGHSSNGAEIAAGSCGRQLQIAQAELRVTSAGAFQPARKFSDRVSASGQMFSAVTSVRTIQIAQASPPLRI